MKTNNKFTKIVLVLIVIFTYKYYDVYETHRLVFENSKPTVVARVKECGDLIANNEYEYVDTKGRKWHELSDKEKIVYCHNTYSYVFNSDSIIKINKHTTFEDIAYALKRDLEIQRSGTGRVVFGHNIMWDVIPTGSCYDELADTGELPSLELLFNEQCY